MTSLSFCTLLTVIRPYVRKYLGHEGDQMLSFRHNRQFVHSPLWHRADKINIYSRFEKQKPEIRIWRIRDLEIFNVCEIQRHLLSFQYVPHEKRRNFLRFFAMPKGRPYFLHSGQGCLSLFILWRCTYVDYECSLLCSSNNKVLSYD